MWTQEQRKAFGKLLVVTAEYLGGNISLGTVELMISDLQDENFDACQSALTAYRKRPGAKALPRPADLVAIIRPVTDARKAAVELAFKIQKAVGKFGYNWQEGYYSDKGTYWVDSQNKIHWSFKDAVIAELGPAGWNIIQARGGWTKIRNAANGMEEGTFIAQLRDQAVSEIELQRTQQNIAIEHQVKPEQKLLDFAKQVKTKTEEP